MWKFNWRYRRTEYLKYAPDIIRKHIVELLKTVTETSEYPEDIKLGHLTSLQKKQENKNIHRKI